MGKEEIKFDMFEEIKRKAVHIFALFYKLAIARKTTLL